VEVWISLKVSSKGYGCISFFLSNIQMDGKLDRDDGIRVLLCREIKRCLPLREKGFCEIQDSFRSICLPRNKKVLKRKKLMEKSSKYMLYSSIYHAIFWAE
jgi:hypothetical protein